MSYLRRLFAPYTGWNDHGRAAGAVLASALLLVALVSVNSLFGYDVAFRALYVLPIWLATRIGGRLGGIVSVLMVAVANVAMDFNIFREYETTTFWVGVAARFVSLSVIMLLIAHIEEALWANRKLAMMDPLTGLLNRRALMESGTDVLSRAKTVNDPLMVVVIDCDGFKKLNDEFGHKAGDEVLQLLACVLSEETRETDLIARTGGDEFVVVLPGSSEEEAKRVMARVERLFEQAVMDAGYRASLSVGLAGLTRESHSMEELLHTADKQMYAKKEQRKAGAYLN